MLRDARQWYKRRALFNMEAEAIAKAKKVLPNFLDNIFGLASGEYHVSTPAGYRGNKSCETYTVLLDGTVIKDGVGIISPQTEK